MSTAQSRIAGNIVHGHGYIPMLANNRTTHHGLDVERMRRSLEGGGAKLVLGALAEYERLTSKDLPADLRQVRALAKAKLAVKGCRFN